MNFREDKAGSQPGPTISSFRDGCFVEFWECYFNLSELQSFQLKITPTHRFVRIKGDNVCKSCRMCSINDTYNYDEDCDKDKM